jgi:hypothetical protein
MVPAILCFIEGARKRKKADGNSGEKENMSDQLERRKATRFRLDLPIELKQGKGEIRDFSYGGAYFETHRSFLVGEPVEFTLCFSQSAALQQSILVYCHGEVLRVTSVNDKVGVAVTLTSHSFELPQVQRGMQ